ncbi:MAG: aminomethyl transferase family protein [Calditrichales bacterium]|nr:MAG: aminomethyl transferase family protein [Calditrichales bacterium]
MKTLFLHEVHQKSGASFISRGDYQVPCDYGDLRAELNAINQTVALIDRSYLGKITVSGNDTLDLINRISTNDLHYLMVNTASDTVFATPKGRLVDYCRVLNTREHLLLITSFPHVNHLMDWINRFIILEDAEVKDASDSYAWFTVIGPRSLTFLNRISGRNVSENDEVIWIEKGEIGFPVIKNSQFKYPAYDLCFKTEDAWPVIDLLLPDLKAVRGELIGDTAFQIIRVESGIPDGGREITQDYNPHEARLTHAVSFTKGCYTGQEVIARLDTYDKVQKYIMIVELSEPLPGILPAELFIDADSVGHLTSYIYDPVTKRSIGLGYLKKMYTTEDDIYVEVKTESHRIPARLRIPPKSVP